MEESHEIEPVGLICIRCGYANDERASRCSKCNSPLGDFGSSTPWEMGNTTSAAYSSTTNPKTKPIVFWGAWLYFGPSAIVAILYVGSYIFYTLSGNTSIDEVNPEIATGGAMILVLCALYGVLSIWALWAVTKGYFRKQ